MKDTWLVTATITIAVIVVFTASSGLSDSIPANPKRGIPKILEAKIPEVNFKNAQLEEIVTYLSAKSDVNIIISKQARELLNPKPVPPEMGIFNGIGIEEGDEDIDNSPSMADNSGITIRLKNIPLKAVLKYVLRTKGLKYIVEDYAIVIVPMGYNPYEAMETEVFHLYKSGEGVTNFLRKGL